MQNKLFWKLGRGVGRLILPGAGVLGGALLFAGLAMPIDRAVPGQAAVWGIDRDAGRVVGLDRELFEIDGWDCRRPIAGAQAAHGIWVVAAREASALGRHELLIRGPGMAPRVIRGGADLGPIIDLETGPSGSALLVEFGLIGKPTRVLWAQDGVAELVRQPGALSVCAGLGKARAGDARTEADAVFFVGDEAGRVTRFDSQGMGQARVDLGGQIGDLAWAPDGRILALDVASPGRLICLDPNLAVMWAVETGLQAEELCMAADGSSVWIADSNEPLAKRFGAHGRLELTVPLPGADVAASLAWGRGGVLLATPGALLHIDGSGQLQPGQGGFDYLTDLVRPGNWKRPSSPGVGTTASVKR